MSSRRSDRKAQKRSRIIRWSVIGTILVAVTVLFILRLHLPGGKALPKVDALCPFGGLETIFSLIAGEGFVKHTALTSVILLAGALVITLLFRRSFCGQICPLGALQEAFGALGKRLFHKRPEIPKGFDRVARFLKYVVLVFFIVWTWRAASLVMRPYDPWAAYAHLTSTQLFTEFGVGFAVLVICLVGSIVFERFFCKYLCPMGAFLSFFSKASVFGIKRDPEVCLGCKHCEKACPMNIAVSSADVVNAAECISCNECVNACPAAGALEIKAVGSKKASPAFMTALVVTIIVVIVGFGIVSDALGGTNPWSSGGSSSQGANRIETETDDSSSYIKGSMSMEEISNLSGIPKERFVDRWGISDQDFGQPLKNIKDVYGFSVDDVKTWVAETGNG